MGKKRFAWFQGKYPTAITGLIDGNTNNVIIKFNINGIFYNRKTDSNGIAMLNITLMSGKYIITSEYDGLKVSNTITIKD